MKDRIISTADFMAEVKDMSIDGQQVKMSNGILYFNYKELPKLPNGKNPSNVCILNNRAFANGYEWKDGEWKRTLRAIWHLVF